MDYQWTIDDVVDSLETAKAADNRGCSLLIGAGCSVRAGIPTAAGFVEEIKKRYRRLYDKAREKTYRECMHLLSNGERHDLIAEYIDNAKINWAHIAIAQLMKSGYVDRVLTTNFDPLVIRACALLNHFPAVYDFAASQLYKPAVIPGQAVFYLHGQSTGFVLMNTANEIKKHADLLAPVFEDAGRGRVWIVVGYSGENDPVFDHLAKVETFDYKLFWICYKNNEPPKHVRERLLIEDKYAFNVKGYDADGFFTLLASKLNSFPPRIVDRPFSYLNELLENLTPFIAPGENTGIDVTHDMRYMIDKAIEQFEEPTSAIQGVFSGYLGTTTQTAWRDFMAGDYSKVISELFKSYENTPELRLPLSWSFLMQGNSLMEQAKTRSEKEADDLFDEAIEKFKAALEIKPDHLEALNNWGNALSGQAKTRSGKEADDLFDEAIEKFKAALEINPDHYMVLFNWGATLSDQAQTRSGKEADDLFDEAIEKFKAALEIKPDHLEALNNWGNTLSDQAKTRGGKEADDLFVEAIEKFKAALEIKPDHYIVLFNWGVILSDQAKTRSGKEADDLFDEAIEKFKAALEIKPDDIESLNNLGIGLCTKAKTKSGQEADDLFDEAIEKFKVALEIKPDDIKTLINLSLGLAKKAETKSGQDADDLFDEAIEKFKAAFEINPDSHEVLSNWGNTLINKAKTKSGEEADKLFTEAENMLLDAESILPGSGSFYMACLKALQGNQDQCSKWLQKGLEHGTLPDWNSIINEPDLDNVKNEKWFKEFLRNL